MATVSVTLPVDGTTATVSQYNTPITTIVNAINGNLDNDNIAVGAAISGSKIADNSINLESKASSDTGWRTVTDSWTYLSATTITVPSDATTKYSVGDKIRLTNSTVKYFYIVSLTTTVLTVSGGSDYTLTNTAISAISFSKDVSPLSFPQWFNYTPTFTGLTTTSGTLVSRFTMEGKNVFSRLSFVFGASSAVSGDVSFSLPTTRTTYAGTANITPVGVSQLFDTSTGTIVFASVSAATTTTSIIRPYLANGTYVNISVMSATVPFTWATGDEIALEMVYETA